jgi:preprotein translocase SecE subunit
MPETMDEKKTVPAPVPAAGKPGDAARKGAAVLVVVGGLCWGLAAAFLISFGSWLGQATIGFSPASSVKVSAGGLVVGLGLGAALAFLSLKKLSSLLSVPKPGQGTWVRRTALVSIGALSLFAAYSFYMLPGASSSWWKDLSSPLVLMGKSLSLKPVLFPAAAVFATIMVAAHVLMNRESWADFLIETEGEIKKVAWPTRREYLGSSAVVVLVVAVVSVFLYLVDEGLTILMRYTGIGF